MPQLQGFVSNMKSHVIISSSNNKLEQYQRDTSIEIKDANSLIQNLSALDESNKLDNKYQSYLKHYWYLLP